MSMRKRALIAIGILVGALVGARVMIALRPEPPRRPPEPETPLVTVRPAERGVGPIPIYGAGTVRPRAETAVVTEYDRKRFEWDGWVDRAETALDEQTRTIDVIVIVPDPFRPGRPRDSGAVAALPPLLVGEFATVEIQGDTADHFVLPRPGLPPGGEVWAVDDAARIRIVSVDVLQEIDDRIYVAGDLRDGQPVVVAGVALATDGMQVRIDDGRER